MVAKDGGEARAASRKPAAFHAPSPGRGPRSRVLRWLSSAIDVGNPGDIHPKAKFPVGMDVVLSAPEAKDPIAVRYAFRANPLACSKRVDGLFHARLTSRRACATEASSFRCVS